MGEKAAAAQQARFHELSLANLSKYHRALNDLALGIWYEGCGDCSKPLDDCQCKKATPVRVYQRMPDRIALEALISHAVGKAVQKRETVTETEIVIQHSVPRPGLKALPEETDDGDDEAGPDLEDGS